MGNLQTCCQIRDDKQQGASSKKFRSEKAAYTLEKRFSEKKIKTLSDDQDLVLKNYLRTQFFFSISNEKKVEEKLAMLKIFDKSYNKKIERIIEKLKDQKLELAEQYNGYYNFTVLRRFVYIQGGNEEEAYEALKKDLERRTSLIKLGKEELRTFIKRSQFFYCGYDYLNNLCIGLRPNKPPAMGKAKIIDLLFYFINNKLHEMCKKKSLSNRLILLIDCDKDSFNLDLLENIVMANKIHFLKIIQQVLVVNINEHLIDQKLTETMRRREFSELILVFDENYKQNLKTVLRPEKCPEGYGGDLKETAEGITLEPEEKKI